MKDFLELLKKSEQKEDTLNIRIKPTVFYAIKYISTDHLDIVKQSI